VIGAFVMFLLLVAFVLVLVFTVGIHNNGVKSPPGSSTTTTTSSP
jgi:hypothetical protein